MMRWWWEGGGESLAKITSKITFPNFEKDTIN